MNYKMNRNERKILLVLALMLSFIFFVAFVPAQTTTEPPSAQFYQNLPSSYYLYPTADYNPWTQFSWQQDYCNKTGMDFLVLIEPTGCEPAVVRSDLLEEQDVPVLCRMTGVKLNPLIQVPYIKSIIPVVENKSSEIPYVTYLPPRVALSYYGPSDKIKYGAEGVPTMSNLGYLQVMLKQQPVEEKMPDNVKANISVKMTYDVAQTYGVAENQFVLPLLTSSEWQDTYKEYSFWRGKGYLRLQDITGLSSAKISVYTSPNSAPIRTVELKQGEDMQAKDEIMLPRFYCGAGVRLRLDEITTPQTRARIIVNGNELLLGPNDDVLDSGCKVTRIDSGAGYGGTVQITCGAQGSKTLELKDFEAKLDINDYNEDSKNLKHREETVTSGDNITLKGRDNKDYNLYVGFIGKISSAGGFDDYVISFSDKNPEKKINKNDVPNIVSRIYGYVKDQREKSLVFAGTIPETQLNQDMQAKKIIPSNVQVYLYKKDITSEFNGLEIKLESATGPEQVYYSKSVEDSYKDALQQWRDVAFAYSTKESPEGSYYGIIALRNVADLAAYMRKSLDKAEILRELIDKYSSSDEPAVINEVEDAREALRQTVSGTGDRSATFSRPNGNYFIELEAIEKPGLGSKEAQVKINNTNSKITVDDSIGDWIVVDIDDTSARFKNVTNQELTISKGNWAYLGPTRVEVIDTTLKKEAKVTVLPFEKERETIANFTVQIGIEKRAIKLSPDKTRDLIAKLNSTISKLENVRDNLGKVVSAWQKACFIGATSLWIKNFVSGRTGESYARELVMKPWSELCSDTSYQKSINAKSISDCYRIKESDINRDIALMKTSLTNTNNFINSVKSKPGVTAKSGLLGLSTSINDAKFMEEAEKNFPSDIKNIVIYEQREIRRIQDGDGKIGYGGTNYTKVSELLKQPGIDKSQKAIVWKNSFSSEIVSINLQKLYGASQLFTEDVKTIVLNLELYKDCSKKSSSDLVNSALCKDAMANSFSKLGKYSQTITNEQQKEGLKDLLGGINAVVVPSDFKAIKAPIYNVRDFKNLRDKPEMKDYSDSSFAYFFSGSSSYIAIVDSRGGGNYAITALFEIRKGITGTEEANIDIIKTYVDKTDDPALTKQIKEMKISNIEALDLNKCNNNEIKTPYSNEIKFWESGVYKGFVALMPLDRRAGWYMATTSYTGLEKELVAWKENADLNTFWICNVGEDGVPNFDFTQGPIGDDCCTQVASVTGAQYEIAGCQGKDCSSNLITKARSCSAKAIKEFAAGNRKINTGDCGTFNLGKPPAARAASQCEDYMSPSDCRIMYNLCDPVMCPASRCDLGGRYPVENVVQSGIIGSLVLCLPNFENGHGVLVPVCLTGVHAGLDSFTGILKSGRDCLQQKLATGQTVGICDQIMSVYMCDFFWRELDPVVKLGVPAISESLSHRGGGEYNLFSESWKQSVDASRYFTDFYAEQSLKAFKERSTAQIGGEVCKRFISTVYPTQAKFFDELTKPESPTQAMAWFDEIAMGGASPNSQYKVFAYIFAGNDQAVYYTVYLKKPSQPGYYQNLPELLLVKDGAGYLPAGQYIAISPDFTAPTGYKEICIRLNEQEICGFGRASTSFALNELQNYYLKNQLDQNIKTQQDCVSGKPTIIPTVTLNIQSAVQNALNPQIYRQGIIRICSTGNPGQSTSETDRYKQVGYCDNQNVGCWLDMNSVNESVNDLGIRQDIMNQSEQKDISYSIDKFNLSTPEESKIMLDNAEPKIQDVKNSIDNFIDKITKLSASDMTDSKQKQLDQEAKDIDRQQIQPLISELKEISDKAARQDEKARADNAIAQLYDLRARLYSKFEMRKMEISNTCANNNGIWLTASECTSKGYKNLGTGFFDYKEHANEICCQLVTQPTKPTTITTGLFLWPVAVPGKIISYINDPRRGTPSHEGIDIESSEGTNILAIYDGTVAYILNPCTCQNNQGQCSSAYGNYIVIRHDINNKKVYSLYAHLKTVNVKQGDNVKKGDTIGTMGKTGNACTATEPNQLHFETHIYTTIAPNEANPNSKRDPLCFFSSSDLSAAQMDMSKYNQKTCDAVRTELGLEKITVSTAKCSDLKTKETCQTLKGKCWWNSKLASPKCLNCPSKCEGNDVWFVGNLLGIDDLIFKSKEDCEQNNCGLSCTWNGEKCVSFDLTIFIANVLPRLNEITAMDLTQKSESELTQLSTELTTMEQNLNNTKSKLTNDQDKQRIDGYIQRTDSLKDKVDAQLGSKQVKTLAELRNDLCPGKEIIYLPANGIRDIRELIVMGTGIMNDNLIDNIKSEVETDLNKNNISFISVEKTQNNPANYRITESVPEPKTGMKGIIACINTNIPSIYQHDQVKINPNTLEAVEWPNLKFFLYTNIPSASTEVYLGDWQRSPGNYELNAEKINEFNSRVGNPNCQDHIANCDPTPIGIFRIYRIQHFPPYVGADALTGETLPSVDPGASNNPYLDWRMFFHPRTGTTGYGFYYHSTVRTDQLALPAPADRMTSWGCVSSYNWQIKKIVILMLRNDNKLNFYDEDCADGSGEGCSKLIDITIDNRPYVIISYSALEFYQTGTIGRIYPDIYHISSLKANQFSKWQKMVEMLDTNGGYSSADEADAKVTVVPYPDDTVNNAYIALINEMGINLYTIANVPKGNLQAWIDKATNPATMEPVDIV